MGQQRGSVVSRMPGAITAGKPSICRTCTRNSLVFNVTDGQVPYASTPGSDPASTRAAVGRTAFAAPRGRRPHRHGPERRSRGHAGSDRRTGTEFFARPGSIRCSAHLSSVPASRSAKRLTMRVNGDCAPAPDLPRLPPPVTRARSPARRVTGVISLANAGLSSFSAPGFTAPPMVYGNFFRLQPLVYPNDQRAGWRRRAAAAHPGQRVDHGRAIWSPTTKPPSAVCR